MAKSITILAEPQTITPANNPIQLVASSTNSGLEGFRYNVKIITNISTTQDVISEMMVYPDSNNNGYLILDVSMIIADQLNKLSYNDYSYQTIKEKEDGLYEFAFKIQEYIGSTSVGDDGLANSSIHYAFKGVVQYDLSWDYELYLLNGTNKKFLTQKKSRSYKLDNYGSLDFFYGLYEFTTITLDWVRVKIYYEGGISSYYFNNFPASPSDRGIMTIPIGPKQLNDMAVNGNLVNFSGTPTSSEVINDKDNIDPTVKYEISYCNSSKIPVSESITIDMDYKCYKHTPVDFLYLGELGTYETFTARQGDVKSYNSAMSEVKTNQNHIIDDMYYHNVGDRGRTVVNKRISESHDVITGWLNDEQTSDLMELFASTDVYIIKDMLTYPVIITNSRYNQKNIKNDRLYNYTISYEMAFEKLTNR
jgi:hypothetical protein